MASGVVLSRHVLAFLPVHASMSFARKLHMLCAYWGFILMSLYLGIHWNMVAGMGLFVFIGHYLSIEARHIIK